MLREQADDFVGSISARVSTNLLFAVAYKLHESYYYYYYYYYLAFDLGAVELISDFQSSELRNLIRFFNFVLV
jgi:hypothetical protein